MSVEQLAGRQAPPLPQTVDHQVRTPPPGSVQPWQHAAALSAAAGAAAAAR